MKEYKFLCVTSGFLAYTCDDPKNCTGSYYKKKEVDEQVKALEEIIQDLKIKIEVDKNA